MWQIILSVAESNQWVMFFMALVLQCMITVQSLCEVYFLLGKDTATIMSNILDELLIEATVQGCLLSRSLLG